MYNLLLGILIGLVISIIYLRTVLIHYEKDCYKKLLYWRKKYEEILRGEQEDEVDMYGMWL